MSSARKAKTKIGKKKDNYVEVNYLDRNGVRNSLHPVDKSFVKIGDKGVTKFIESDSQLVRTVTEIEKRDNYGSGASLTLSDGGYCDCCKRPWSKELKHIDASWFIPLAKYRVAIPKAEKKKLRGK